MTFAAAPQLLQNPCCDFINVFPWWFFLVVHIALFAVGSYFAFRALDNGSTTLGIGFGLFAAAEIVYMTYHVNITQFLFSHTIAEVLDGLAFVALFVGVVRRESVERVARERVPAGPAVTR